MINALMSQFPLSVSCASGELIMLILRMPFVRKPSYADKAYGVRISLYQRLDSDSEFSKV